MKYPLYRTNSTISKDCRYGCYFLRWPYRKELPCSEVFLTKRWLLRPPLRELFLTTTIRNNCCILTLPQKNRGFLTMTMTMTLTLLLTVRWTRAVEGGSASSVQHERFAERCQPSVGCRLDAVLVRIAAAVTQNVHLICNTQQWTMVSYMCTCTCIRTGGNIKSSLSKLIFLRLLTALFHKDYCYNSCRWNH